MVVLDKVHPVSYLVDSPLDYSDHDSWSLLSCASSGCKAQVGAAHRQPQVPGNIFHACVTSLLLEALPQHLQCCVLSKCRYFHVFAYDLIGIKL